MAARRALALLWVARAAAVALKADHPLCTEAETLLLRSVEDLVVKINGKMSTRQVVPPPYETLQCGNKPKAQRLGCWKMWGLVEPVAKCWADEVDHVEEYCRGNCDAGGATSSPCRQCRHEYRRGKWSCVYTEMNIGATCSACKMAAYQYWDQNCEDVCAGAFAKNAPTALPCQRCSDRLYDELLPGCDATLNVSTAAYR